MDHGNGTRPLARGAVHVGSDLLGAGELSLSCDAVVIGTGAGGAACGATLAEHGLDVVLLEEGGYYRRTDFTADPPEMLRRLYREAAMTTVLGMPGSPSFPLPMGRCVGGSTTINSGTCFPIPPRVLAHWKSAFGADGLTYDQLGVFYDRVSRDIHVEAPPLESIGKNGLLMHRGAQALKLRSGVIPRNAKGCRGSGVCTIGCPTDSKQSTLVSYVPRALAAGARVLCDVHVEKVLADNARARGVLANVIDRETGEPRRPVRVHAPIVVVACGSCLTPLLLEKSGLGLSSGLLGRNLHVHPAGKIIALFREEVRGWEGIPQSYYIDEWHDQGIMLEGIHLPPGMGSMSLPYAGRMHAELMERYDHIATFGILVSERSSHGRVRSAPGGGLLMTYTLHDEDAQKVVAGLAHASEVAFAAGAEAVHTGIHGVPPLRRAEDVKRLLWSRSIRGTDLELIAFHPLGTARFGHDASRSVVDPQLESHDVLGLFVADGSVFPSSLEVNPQLTIMAFAVRAGDYIASRMDRYRRS